MMQENAMILFCILALMNRVIYKRNFKNNNYKYSKCTKNLIKYIYPRENTSNIQINKNYFLYLVLSY